MRLVIAECAVDYSGRLDAHLPRAKRLLMIKADGSILIHSDGGSYKPLNWMTPPCRLEIQDPNEDEAECGVSEIWQVLQGKTDDRLRIQLYQILSEVDQDLGIDPGLSKDGVEAHLQQLLAEQVDSVLGAGWKLGRREHPTPVGPVDLLVYDPEDMPVAIEVKRRGGIDGVEQLTRYLTMMIREERFHEIRGIFAAQEVTKQARTLAEDRGIECLILDYAELRGMDNIKDRLF